MRNHPAQWPSAIVSGSCSSQAESSERSFQKTPMMAKTSVLGVRMNVLASPRGAADAVGHLDIQVGCSRMAVW